MPPDPTYAIGKPVPHGTLTDVVGQIADVGRKTGVVLNRALP